MCLVLLWYKGDAASTFFMIMANGIKVKLVMSCGFRAPQHNPSPNRDIKDFSGEDYDTANCVNCIITLHV